MSEATFKLRLPEGMCASDALEAGLMAHRAMRHEPGAEFDRRLSVHMLATANLMAFAALVEAERPAEAMEALMERLATLIEAAVRANVTAPGGEQ